MTGFEQAFSHEVLNKTISCLQKAKLTGVVINDSDFQRLFSRAGWLATYLSNSNIHKHRQKALLFAALSKMVLHNNANVEALCYTIFARTGALPAAMHLKTLVGDKQEYIGPTLGALTDEFISFYADSYSDLGDGIVFTEFQKKTADSLELDRYGIISAPTSAGKSFVIHEYVKNRFRNSNKFVALFIVPTKALISQTCAMYRKFMIQEDINISVFSTVSESLVMPAGNAVFVLTQERCIRLLFMPIARELSFMFADEIQSLEDGERGALLEYVLHELKTVASQARLFAAGPFIANGLELGRSLFSEACKSIHTEDSPVSQMIVQLTPIKGEKSLQIKVVDSIAPDYDFTFSISTNSTLYSRWKGSNTKAICDSVRKFATDDPSIVYARGQGTAQNWAKTYILDYREKITISKEATALITYIEDSIHPKCSLVSCLEHRVAYHHAGLPDFVREEIEDLFNHREIDILFCTSTLLEGVNLR